MSPLVVVRNAVFDINEGEAALDVVVVRNAVFDINEGDAALDVAIVDDALLDVVMEATFTIDLP